MKRILCALLSVACLFTVTPAHAELVTVPAKFTYQRVPASAVSDSEWVTSPNVSATSSGWAAPNRVDTTAWVPLSRAAFNSPGHTTGTTTTLSDSLLGFRVLLEGNDQGGDGSGSAVTADSMIVTIQVSIDPDVTSISGAHGAAEATAALLSNDRLDYSTAGPKPIAMVTTLFPPLGLHASPSASRLVGAQAIRVLVKQDNTVHDTATTPAKWRVKIQYITDDDRTIIPTGSR